MVSEKLLLPIPFFGAMFSRAKSSSSAVYLPVIQARVFQGVFLQLADRISFVTVQMIAAQALTPCNYC